MANHVENIVSIEGDEQQIRKMLEAIQNSEYGVGTVDFNNIIPMPDSLDIEAGGITNNGLKAYKEFIDVYTLAGTRKDLDLLNIPLECEKAFLNKRTDVNADEWSLGKQAFQNLLNYGCSTWYDWRISNWGTKWNAYGYDPGTDYSGGESLHFQTAWSAPHPILEKLSETYPDIVFNHEWADEDLGSNCGYRIYHQGKMLNEFIPEGVQAMQFALKVWDYDPVDLGLALNKTGTGYISMTEDKYRLVELFGKPMLFTKERIENWDIPEGLHRYHLSKTGDGRFDTLESVVDVNFGGSVITDEPLDLGIQEYLDLTDDVALNFLETEMTFEEYMQGDFKLNQTQEGLQL